MTQELLDPEQTKAALEQNHKLLQLRALEKIIDATGESARRHWAAWRTIREQELYLVDGYKSWDDYCKRRWNVGRSAIEKQITAAETFDNLAGKIFTKEELVPDSHMRALAHFPKDLQVEIYEQAKRTAPGDRLTAEWIEKTANRVTQEREEVAREKKRESVGAAPPPPPKPPKTPKKDTEPTEEDQVALAAAQHIITNASKIKTVLGQMLRSLRKIWRFVCTLDEYESSVENLLRRDAEKLEGMIEDLSAKDRKALGCADNAAESLKEFRLALKDKEDLRKRFRPAVESAEKHVEQYRERLGIILYEEEGEDAGEDED